MTLLQLSTSVPSTPSVINQQKSTYNMIPRILIDKVQANLIEAKLNLTKSLLSQKFSSTEEKFNAYIEAFRNIKQLDKAKGDTIFYKTVSRTPELLELGEVLADDVSDLLEEIMNNSNNLSLDKKAEYLLGITRILVFMRSDRIFATVDRAVELIRSIYSDDEKTEEKYVRLLKQYNEALFDLYQSNNEQAKASIEKYSAEIVKLGERDIRSHIASAEYSEIYADNLAFRKSKEAEYEYATAATHLMKTHKNSDIQPETKVILFLEAERLTIKAIKVAKNKYKYKHLLIDIKKSIIDVCLSHVEELDKLPEPTGEGDSDIQFFKEEYFFMREAVVAAMSLGIEKTLLENVSVHLNHAMDYKYEKHTPNSDIYDYEDLIEDYAKIYFEGFLLTKNKVYYEKALEIVRYVITNLEIEIEEAEQETEFCKVSNDRDANRNCVRELVRLRKHLASSLASLAKYKKEVVTDLSIVSEHAIESLEISKRNILFIESQSDLLFSKFEKKNMVLMINQEIADNLELNN
eukprot:CAMPEP_0170516524 /NCGR_PEP_ID=MMETSP0209-20121228/2706_1 /TAXON_ID=665100 ORGANISM="Litonotus pictus, Strain P1" /NCGR_SAMPLE_ID=MMETSP0209 /ASSEMBLY_ACC=CAM_ASM_000301 /LENGTH=519 /DNA_ID=CAMNT_0010801427 /DNA_START=41 /DNA_END=1600 /DNA_ORIENTATION=-